MKITDVTITPMPRPMPLGMFDPMPEVIATFEDGSTKTLFSFYPDEVSFQASEFATADPASPLCSPFAACVINDQLTPKRFVRERRRRDAWQIRNDAQQRSIAFAQVLQRKGHGSQSRQ